MRPDAANDHGDAWESGEIIPMMVANQKSGSQRKGRQRMVARRLFTFLAAVVASHVLQACSSDFDGKWMLRIEDLGHREIVSMKIQFAKDKANSCIHGDWRKVIVETAKTSRKDFFPIGDPLSYTIDGSTLTIGRNGVCDGYLHLSGPLTDGVVKGNYQQFGIDGGNQLGYFQLSKLAQ